MQNWNPEDDAHFPRHSLCSPSPTLHNYNQLSCRAAASCIPANSLHPCDRGRAPEENGEQPPQLSVLIPKPPRAPQSFSTLTLGTRLKSLSPYYWEVFFQITSFRRSLFKNKTLVFVLVLVVWGVGWGPSTCSLQKTWIIQNANRRIFKSPLA